VRPPHFPGAAVSVMLLIFLLDNFFGVKVLWCFILLDIVGLATARAVEAAATLESACEIHVIPTLC